MKRLSTLIILVFVANAALAEYAGPSNVPVITVRQLLSTSTDNQYATLRGRLVSHDSQDTIKEMTKASQEAVAGYKKHGVYGMIEKVARCYSQLSEKMLYCSYIDLASKYIELTASQARGYPPSQFFSDESFSDRTSEIFQKAGLDNGQDDILLKIISPEINKLVDIELSKSTG